MAGRIFAESNGAESTRFYRMTRVVEVDGVLSACFQALWEVDEDCACFAAVAEPSPIEKYFVDVECGMQIELDALAILEHSEANGVLASKKLFVRVDTDIQVVEQEMIVGAVGSVGAAQNIRARRRGRSRRSLRCRRRLRGSALLRGGRKNWRSGRLSRGGRVRGVSGSGLTSRCCAKVCEKKENRGKTFTETRSGHIRYFRPQSRAANDEANSGYRGALLSAPPRGRNLFA